AASTPRPSTTPTRPSRGSPPPARWSAPAPFTTPPRRATPKPPNPAPRRRLPPPPPGRAAPPRAMNCVLRRPGCAPPEVHASTSSRPPRRCDRSDGAVDARHPVADPAHRLDPARRDRVLADLLAEVAHVHFDAAFVGVGDEVARH